MMPQLVSRGFRDTRADISRCRSLRSPFFHASSESNLSDERSIVCPKAQRVPTMTSGNCNLQPSTEVLNPAMIRLKRSMSPVGCDGNDAGREILEIVLRKGFAAEISSRNCELCSSPPFFTGSPPSRVRNPVVRDTEFLCTPLRSPISPAVSTSTAAAMGKAAAAAAASISPPTASRKPQSSPSVRVEGFECKGMESCLLLHRTNITSA